MGAAGGTSMFMQSCSAYHEARHCRNMGVLLIVQEHVKTCVGPVLQCKAPSGKCLACMLCCPCAPSPCAQMACSMTDTLTG